MGSKDLPNIRINVAVGERSCSSFNHNQWKMPFKSWLVLIASVSSWLTSDSRQVHCLFQRSSMEIRNCSDFPVDDFPQISVKYGEREFSNSFSIHEDKVLDHEMFYFKCVAKYPIEWITYDPSPTGHVSWRAAKSLASHLHIYRTFSNFFDRNSYRFAITTNVRYKKGVGFKQINGTCRSIVKPHCLSRTITSVDDVDGIALNISIDSHWKVGEITREAASETSQVDYHNVDDRGPADDHCDYKIYYKEEPGGPRLSFTCEQDDGTPTSITFNHQCSNAMTCLNFHRNFRLPPHCAQPMVHNETCVGCEGKQLRLSQGIIGCESSMEQEVHGRPKRLLFFFTSIPEGRSSTKLYFRMEDASGSEMMKISEIPHEVYLGHQLTVGCNVSNYYFAGGARLALKFADSDELTFLKAAPKNIEVADHFGGKTVIETSIPMTTDRLQKVYCFAPVWNSFEWVNQSRPIKVKEIVSGDIIVAVSITVFLTALLAAMMFGLLWVKVGKKHGRLNILTTSEIEEFRRGSIADENKPIKTLSNFDVAYGTSATYDTSYEIKRDQLLLDEAEVLGHGQFGLVLKGVVKNSQNGARMDVAVKTLKTKADVGSLKALLSELKILASIGKNGYVVNLVAACTKRIGTGEVYVAVEYCPNGNLQTFLRLQRQTFRNQMENDVLVIETPIRTLANTSECLMTIDLVKWAWEAARGMEFLGSKKVIHGDLATRNILLTANFVAKISDFGLSRQLVDYYYVQKETGPMPWKWMSLESLRDMKFSIQSDIWSFGVTLWELFTLAESPYSGCSWSAEFVETLAAGHRLGKPKYATSEMYDLMRACWKSDWNSRPSFFAIRMFFDDILTQCTSQDYIQFSPSLRRTIPTDEDYQNLPLLHSPKIIIEEDEEEEEGEDDVFE